MRLLLFLSIEVIIILWVLVCLNVTSVTGTSFSVITWLVASPNDMPNTHINPFSGQHRVLSQKRGKCEYKIVVNKAQSFRIVFIYQTTYLISISTVLKISCDGCLFLLAAFIIYYIHYMYILYIWYHGLEKKEMKRTRDAGRRIIMVVISARRPVPLPCSPPLQGSAPLHRSAPLQ